MLKKQRNNFKLGMIVLCTAHAVKMRPTFATQIDSAHALYAAHGVLVRPEWLTAVARGATPAKVTKAHTLAPLEGLVIVPSGLTPPKRTSWRHSPHSTAPNLLESLVQIVRISSRGFVKGQCTIMW